MKLLIAIAEVKLQTFYNYASYALIPAAAAWGASRFKDLLYTALMSLFGALVGFLVRLCLDHLYEKYKARKAAQKTLNPSKNDGKDS